MFLVRLYDLCLFGFVCFLFRFVTGEGLRLACDCGTPWTFFSYLSIVVENIILRLSRYIVDAAMEFIAQLSIRNITKTRIYNCDPLKPHFYIVKLGLTGVCIIFLILLKT